MNQLSFQDLVFRKSIVGGENAIFSENLTVLLSSKEFFHTYFASFKLTN